MGQRFSIDAAIMQELVYNRVSENAAGEAASASPTRSTCRRPSAATSPSRSSTSRAPRASPATPRRWSRWRAGIDQATDDLWTASLAAQWLAMLRPLLTVKGEGYPLFAQGEAWARRNLVAFAGSYAELKHDTVLYAKQVMAEAGGGPLEERDDRGYVEPEPEFFGRLAALVDATSKGLSSAPACSARPTRPTSRSSSSSPPSLRRSRARSSATRCPPPRSSTSSALTAPSSSISGRRSARTTPRTTCSRRATSPPPS